ILSKECFRSRKSPPKGAVRTGPFSLSFILGEIHRGEKGQFFFRCGLFSGAVPAWPGDTPKRRDKAKTGRCQWAHPVFWFTEIRAHCPSGRGTVPAGRVRRASSFCPS